MRRLILLAGLAVWMIAFAVAADEPSKKIEGAVMDADKKPLAGAEVTLYEYAYKALQSTLVKTVKTGEDGKFSLESTINPNDPIGQKYNIIQVAKPGLAWRTTHVSGREEATPLTMILFKPAVFVGQVVNKKGEPVTGAKVYPTAYKQGASEDETISVHVTPGMDAFMATTDGQGRFRFEQLPAEAKVGVTVDHPDYARFGNNPYQGGFEAGTEDQKIELAPAGSISGRILDENSKPVAGVRVSCYARNSGGGMVPVVSDADGRYTIDRLSPANYTLASQSMSEEGAPKGLMMQRSGVEVAEGQKLEGIDLKWMAGTVLRGRVVDSATSQPIQKANVHAYKMNRTNSDVGWSASAATNKEGAFELRVGEGQISVQAYAQKYLPDDNRGQRQLEIKQGQTPDEVVLYLKSNPPITVSGVVVDADGKPVAGAKVSTTGHQSKSEKTGKDGKFSMKIVRQQSGPSSVEPMTLMANSKGMAGSAEIPDNAGATLNVTIKMKKAGSVSGQVVEPGGKPLAGATVQLMTRINMGRGFSTRNFGEPAKTDKEGNFEIGGLSDGELYGIRVSAKGHGSMTDYEIKGDSGKTIDKGKIELPLANAFVELTVLDDNGQPVKDARVYAYGQKQPEANSERNTNAEGKLKLGPMCPGELSISLNKDGFSYANTRLELTSGTQPVEMEMVREAGSSERLKAGNPAPKLEGVTWCKEPADMNGRAAALVFFAPGNRPSQMALSRLADLNKEFGDKLAVAAVCDASVKEDALKELVASKGYAFPVGQVASDKKSGWASPAFRAYEVRAVPSIVLIGADGKIKQSEVPIGKIEQSVREMMKN
ncbi:MAG: carboxypeptidase regulatory-like domain-containing protein [Candidatus Sumerlaeia bacterium]